MNRLLAYFDLNNRQASTPFSQKPLPQPEPPAVDDDALPDFQAVAFGASRRRRARHTARELALWEQIVFYIGTVLGVLFSSSIIQFQAGKTVTLAITATTIVLASLIGLVLMPFVDKKGIKDDSPFIVQLGLFVQTGVFWSVIFTLIGKAYG